MQFNEQCTGKKRQMLLLPEVNPDSLIFFFERGNSGMSWSFRNYSVPYKVVEQYARNFNWSADEVRRRAKFAFDAPTVDTNDLKFWHEYTQAGNKRMIPKAGEPAAMAPCLTGQEVLASQRSDSDFPILKLAELRSSPKGSKGGDLDRILHSSNSEDYVTWNWNSLIGQLRDFNLVASLARSRTSDKPEFGFPL
jgi:hypothetical protein